jgi:hypothetical protein
MQLFISMCATPCARVRDDVTGSARSILATRAG